MANEMLRFAIIGTKKSFKAILAHIYFNHIDRPIEVKSSLSSFDYTKLTTVAFLELLPIL